MSDIKKIINQGIKIEDEFIELYMSIIKEEGFLYYFPDAQLASKSLKTLIKESRSHKQTLENIINEI